MLATILYLVVIVLLIVNLIAIGNVLLRLTKIELAVPIILSALGEQNNRGKTSLESKMN